MKNILSSITNNDIIQVYYKLMCDDKRATTLLCDYYFELYETDKLNDLLNVCNSNRYNYDLVIEHWCEKTQEIIKHIYLVSNNYKNNL
jgi:hypothetical protein